MSIHNQSWSHSCPHCSSLQAALVSRSSLACLPSKRMRCTWSFQGTPPSWKSCHICHTLGCMACGWQGRTCILVEGNTCNKIRSCLCQQLLASPPFLPGGRVSLVPPILLRLPPPAFGVVSNWAAPAPARQAGLASPLVVGVAGPARAHKNKKQKCG